jgi:hypothetical protein
MRRTAAVAVLAIVVIGVALFVRDHERSAPFQPTPIDSLARSQTMHTGMPARSRPVLAMPAPAVADAVVPDACKHGTAGRPEFWDCLPRTPPWDAERARYLLDRLAKHVDVHLAPDKIECRTRCCRVFVPSDVVRVHDAELASSVGLRIGPTDGYISIPVEPGDHGSEFMITTCWRPGSIDDYPDRAIERDELRAAAAADLAACERGLDAPIASPADAGRAAPPEAVRRSIASPADAGRAASPEAVRRSIERLMLVEVDPSGDVTGIHPATGGDDAFTLCAAAALEHVAAFAPAPDTMAGTIPVRVGLP